MNRKPVVQPVSDFSQLQKAMKDEPFTGYVYVAKDGAESSVPAEVQKFAKNKRDLHSFFVAKPGELVSGSCLGLTCLIQQGEVL